MRVSTIVPRKYQRTHYTLSTKCTVFICRALREHFSSHGIYARSHQRGICACLQSYRGNTNEPTSHYQRNVQFSRRALREFPWQLKLKLRILQRVSSVKSRLHINALYKLMGEGHCRSETVAGVFKSGNCPWYIWELSLLNCCRCFEVIAPILELDRACLNHRLNHPDFQKCRRSIRIQFDDSHRNWPELRTTKHANFEARALSGVPTF